MKSESKQPTVVNIRKTLRNKLCTEMKHFQTILLHLLCQQKYE